MRKRKDWLAINQDNVSKCGEMFYLYKHTNHYTIRPGLEHVIYHTRREHTNHYTTRPGLEPLIYHTRREQMVSVLPSFVIDHVFKTWSCGVMVSVLPSCVLDHVFKTWSCGNNSVQVEHFTTLGHIILISSQPIFPLSH
jgi:hypothetical protein